MKTIHSIVSTHYHTTLHKKNSYIAMSMHDTYERLAWTTIYLSFLLILSIPALVISHPFHLQRKALQEQDPFRQLNEVWPTPNESRLASGAPGPDYWQQKVDYDIDIRLNEALHQIEAQAQITYHNHSPHQLSFLWVQLDQNRFKPTSLSHQTGTLRKPEEVYHGFLNREAYLEKVKAGFHIFKVEDAQGKALPYTIVDTMMRIDLPQAIPSQGQFKFRINWNYNILKHKFMWARNGYETLKTWTELEKKRQKVLKQLKKSMPKDKTKNNTKAKTKANTKAQSQTENQSQTKIINHNKQSKYNVSNPNKKENIKKGTQSITHGTDQPNDSQLKHIQSNQIKAKKTTKGSTNSTHAMSKSAMSKSAMSKSAMSKSAMSKSAMSKSSKSKALEKKLPARMIYEVAQWFPRLAAYHDHNGWQNKAFLGNGEFTLEFGDYNVRITLPAHYTVAATGTLQNPQEVLSTNQQKRLQRARTALAPHMVITPEEAYQQSLTQSKTEKTWEFKADNVRDFAFAASNCFIWDAWGHHTQGQVVMAMSFYPHEAQPLWNMYSTHAIVHTLEVYEKFAFNYPYPVAISVNGPVFGMEYPMISFNGPRPEADGTYSSQAKYGLISVIIHEVGHFFFPMIVNSDERQWTWLDEGINTFVQFQAERAWEEDFPSWRGAPEQIVKYMRSKNQVPIMTNSESLLQFGSNAYGKPSTALGILRESVIGPKLFDTAFKTYAQQWRFKRPTPSDFFRTMEQVSGVDLDWFWRGWFYSTLPVDIAVESVVRYRLHRNDPKIDKEAQRVYDESQGLNLIQQRDQDRRTRVKRYPALIDFYNQYDEYSVSTQEIKKAEQQRKSMKSWQKEELQSKKWLYRVTLLNKGGLITHVPVLLVYKDGSEEIRTWAAEIWRKNPEKIEKIISLDHELLRLEVDPYRETADIDRSNNAYPQKIDEVELKLKSWRRKKGLNFMQKDEIEQAYQRLKNKKKKDADTQKKDAQNIKSKSQEKPLVPEEMNPLHSTPQSTKSSSPSSLIKSSALKDLKTKKEIQPPVKATSKQSSPILKKPILKTKKIDQ